MNYHEDHRPDISFEEWVHQSRSANGLARAQGQGEQVVPILNHGTWVWLDDDGTGYAIPREGDVASIYKEEAVWHEVDRSMIDEVSASLEHVAKEHQNWLP